MKRVILFIVFCFIVASTASAQTYEAVTADNEVNTVETVQVKIVTTVETEEFITLKYINSQIAAVRTKIQELEDELIELRALEYQVRLKAEKVKLVEVE